jgi:hypothetical protein
LGGVPGLLLAQCQLCGTIGAGKSTNTDYVYVMEFDGDKIRHMTKIWNAGWAMRDLGWA